MSEFSDLNTQKILADLKTVVTDADEMLQATGNMAGEQIVEVRERIGEHLRNAKQCLADAQAAVIEHTKAAACACDCCVREKPWQTVGIAAAIGLLLGLMISRRR